MKRIKLTQGKFAIVDDEDYNWLNQWKWFAHKNTDTYYATRHIRGTKKLIRMHQQILKPVRGMEIDHCNRNGLDNRRTNIRICTHSQNLANQKIQKNRSSKYKGVKKHPQTRKWRTTFCGKHLGYFDTEEEAARAYNKALVEKHGKYARLNIIKKQGQGALFEIA